MQFDTENPVIKLCAEGMQKEGEGKPAEARQLFYEAWEKASTQFEKFTAAHYVARHQNSATEKLAWDEQCLALAQSIPGEPVQSTYPSLYLNIAKCHEDLGNKQEALRHYKLASSFEHLLADDGYGSMIKAGIKKGLQRVQ